MDIDDFEAGTRQSNPGGVDDPGFVNVSPQGTPHNSPTTATNPGGFDRSIPPGSPQKAPTFPGTPPGGNSPRPPTLPPDFAQAASHSSGDMSTSPGIRNPGSGAGFDMFAKQQVGCLLDVFSCWRKSLEVVKGGRGVQMQAIYSHVLD